MNHNKKYYWISPFNLDSIGIEKVAFNQIEFRKLITSKDSLIDEFNSIEIKSEKKRFYCLDNCSIYFPMSMAILENVISKIEVGGAINYEAERHFRIQNCQFNLFYGVRNSRNRNLEFKNCYFEEIDLSQSSFSGTLKVYNSTFNITNFTNCSFNSLADFFGCYFKKEVIFYKTDFLGTTVFSATTFQENALFTYSLIDKLIIFRGTNFKNGLDLSCAIITGDINPFDIRLENYASEVIKESDSKKYEEIYEKHICKDGKIPIKNQRETYRILKEAFIKREDIASSIKYKVFEKETLRKELEVVTYSPTTLAKKCPGLDKKLFQIENWFEKLNLCLNKWSNNYGKSYSRALVFILVAGFIFFYFSSIASSKYYFAWDIEFCEGLGDFAQFLLPTHDIEYLGLKESQPTEFFVLDFLGRLVVGYGIYQFIQAFRKYR